ncbi:creatininase family protein [Candidatus Latescibacterota bacterium]
MPDNNRRRDFLRAMTLTGLAAGGLPSARADAEGKTPSWCPPRKGAGKDKLPDSVMLQERTRREVRLALAGGTLKAAIIPTGSTEQHNEHLAMVMDTAGALLISQQAALNLYPEVVVTPPVSIGVSPHWMNRRGTLTLRKEIFQAVVQDICESLVAHGIKTILIVNGHGGNIKPLAEVVPRFREKLGVTLEACSYWDSFRGEQATDFVDTGSIPSHAAEFETSIALAAFPERVRYERVDHDRAKLTISEKERKWDKATFEESKLASPEKGERIIVHAIGWVTAKLTGMME